MQDKVLALLLAGGKGTRLGVLTEKICKPAVPFGGFNRLIDFPLSNCLNSQITKVGVLTRHSSKTPVLGEILRNLQHREIFGGELYILPENYLGEYRGTADAVYKRLKFIESFKLNHVLILCADHVYKMDYSKMLKFHHAQNADLTIAVVEVPWSTASSFGILNTNSEGSILEFEEKPENPESNLASTGIYIFNKSVLKKYLEEDQRDPNSDNDFGKNIIPKMVEDNSNVFAYNFNGYWKDVGTIRAYWEANLDLLLPEPQIDLEDPDWPIYKTDPRLRTKEHLLTSKNYLRSRISEDVKLNGNDIEKSIISKGVEIGENIEIKNSIVFPETNIAHRKNIKNEIVDGSENIKVLD